MFHQHTFPNIKYLVRGLLCKTCEFSYIFRKGSELQLRFLRTKLFSPLRVRKNRVVMYLLDSDQQLFFQNNIYEEY